MVANLSNTALPIQLSNSLPTTHVPGFLFLIIFFFLVLGFLWPEHRLPRDSRMEG